MKINIKYIYIYIYIYAPREKTLHHLITILKYLAEGEKNRHQRKLQQT
jgi:hypothetical protein